MKKSVEKEHEENGENGITEGREEGPACLVSAIAGRCLCASVRRRRRPPPPCLGSAPPEAAALEAGSHARGAASMGRQAGRHLGVLLRGGWRTTGRTIEEGGSLEGERLAPADLVEDDRWRLQLMCGSVAMAGAGRQRARKEGGRWARNRQPRWLNGFGFWR
jgi:hypothetical protein